MFHLLSCALIGSSLVLQSAALGSDLPKDIPAEFDWRNVNGSSYVTPILNQLSGPRFCGSACAAHNHASYISDRIKIAAARNDPAVGEITSGDVVLSVQALINCAGKGEVNSSDCSVGGTKVVDYLKTNGIPDVTCAPYQGYKQECSPINTCYRWSPG